MRFFTFVFCIVWSNFSMSQSIAFGSCHKVNDPNSDVILTSMNLLFNKYVTAKIKIPNLK